MLVGKPLTSQTNTTDLGGIFDPHSQVASFLKLFLAQDYCFDLLQNKSVIRFCLRLMRSSHFSMVFTASEARPDFFPDLNGISILIFNFLFFSGCKLYFCNGWAIH
jgi:hypothetical protein